MLILIYIDLNYIDLNSISILEYIDSLKFCVPVVMGVTSNLKIILNYCP